MRWEDRSCGIEESVARVRVSESWRVVRCLGWDGHGLALAFCSRRGVRGHGGFVIGVEETEGGVDGCDVGFALIEGFERMDFAGSVCG